MKTTIAVILLFITTLASYSQYEQEYVMNMVHQQKALQVANTIPALQDLANNFERISSAESDKWHPLYYASLCYIYMSFKASDAQIKDDYLNKAQIFLDKAFEIYPDESELFVLQGFIYQAILQVNPNERGREYFVLAGEALNQAKELNTENPRVYYLIGVNLLNAPESVGGGTEAACQYFQTATEKFPQYTPPHVLSPSWGGEENQKRFSQFCGDFD